jgi:23S rRNA pseudouridine1911/1915/1917 synthase
VLYEDDELIVVDKPAGMVVHPAGEITRGTLTNALAHRWGAPPALVHRLDRDTSGVLVATRTRAAQERLIAQFRGREVNKRYVALVYGRLSEARGRIDVPLGRDRKNRLRMVAGEGRAALTLYEVRERWDEFTLLDVEIKTGRTHQIRVHCAHLGHPVVADEMYGKGRAAQVRDCGHRVAVEALGRQFLHAARLGFEHPATGERLELEAPLPDDLQALLGVLRAR